MALIDDQAKNVALKIQEALRGTVAVDFASALELGMNLVKTHGINKVATVDGLRQFAAAELRELADDLADSAVPTHAQVVGAGYSEEAAAKIVAEETAKAAALKKAQDDAAKKLVETGTKTGNDPAVEGEKGPKTEATGQAFVGGSPQESEVETPKAK